MATKTSSSSELSKKMHSYFASLSSASARILDDVRNISLAHSRPKEHTTKKTAVGGSSISPNADGPDAWSRLSDHQRAQIVIETLVPSDLEKRYRELPSETGGAAWPGGPLGPLASFVDPSQPFQLVEIRTATAGSCLPSAETFRSDPSWPPVATRTFIQQHQAVGETSAAGAGVVIAEEDINGQKIPITWRDEHARAFNWYSESCDSVAASRDEQPPPPPFVVGLHPPTDAPSPPSAGRSTPERRQPRRSSRASTPERRPRSPRPRPSQAPPPPPACHPAVSNQQAAQSHSDTAKEQLQKSHRCEASSSLNEGSSSMNSFLSHNDITGAESAGRRERSISGERALSGSTSRSSQHPAGTAASGGKKRQAPKPPVSPMAATGSAAERSSSASLASITSTASSASRAVLQQQQQQQERPRSSFCASTGSDQASDTIETPTSSIARLSPVMQHGVSAHLRSKLPPHQLKKVDPPVAPKLMSSSESIVATPVISDDIPKTGFDFLDNW